MAQEIERKFLVNGTAWRDLAEGVVYRQGYLAVTPERVARLKPKAIRQGFEQPLVAMGQPWMLPNGPDVEQTLFGQGGVAEAMTGASLFIDMSTIAPEMTDSLAARLASRGIRMIDAPVGGTSEYAEQGALLILAGGAFAMWKVAA